MKELSKQDNGFLSVLHAAVETPAAVPYSCDILLLETVVAGTSHVAGIEDLEPFLREGDRLTLVRVPDNPSDHNAIKIFNRDGLKVGYVPRQDNQILARLMDAGKLLFAVIRGKRWKTGWLELRIAIFMTDE